MIRVDRQDELAIVRLRRDVTDALNLPLPRALSGALQELGGDSGVRAVVLACSNDKFFSIGFDIPELLEVPREEFRVF